MFKILIKLSSALEAGKQLRNPTIWKNRSVTINLVMVVLGLVCAVIQLQWPDFFLSDDVLLEAATAIAILLGIFNSYFTVATSKKIGIKNGQD